MGLLLIVVSAAVLVGATWTYSWYSGISDRKIQENLHSIILSKKATIEGFLEERREDAEALSKLWGTTVEEAKTALASKLTEGYRDLAKQVVAEAHAKKKPAADGSVKPVKPVSPVLKPVKPAVKPVNKPGLVTPKAPK